MATQTLGRYQIIREIARSNDIVYEARDPVMGRRVALKELAIPPSLTGSARRERIARFFREAKAAGSLSPHPHIVTLYEVGQQGERYFIAMEYLEGRPLRDVLQMDGPMPVARALRLAAQVCEALDYAHARGIIHRDIKPDNIHVLPGDVVKLTDFGIARITAEPGITADGQVFGTPSYMSPEQVAGKPLDARTDLYSLGITLFEMLSGRKPFTGDSVVTITYNIMNQEPPPLPGVAPVIQEIVTRAIAKAPEGRFPNAAALRDALVRAAGGSADTALPGNALAGTAANGTPAVPPPDADPEITLDSPPPLYVPRRSSATARFLQRNREFLTALGLAVTLALACVFFIWAANSAYHTQQRRTREAAATGIFQSGVTHFNSGRYAEALADFERARQAAPDTPLAREAARSIAAAHITLGNTALSAGQPQRAAWRYQAALQADPQSYTAMYALGQAYQEMGRGDQAVQQWERVLSEGGGDPIVSRARESLANAYYRLGRQAEAAGSSATAAGYYRKCMATDPASQAASFSRAALERMQGGATPPFAP